MNHLAKSPKQMAYDYIRDEIFSGRFVGGMRLKSDAIAQSIGVSRMPVRDALRQLEAEGLVLMQPNRGAMVTNLTAEDILELFEMRAVLEGLAASHAARNITPGDLKKLTLSLERMEHLKDDHALWLEAHDALHDNVCALSGRPQLITQIRIIRQQVRPYTRIYSSIAADPEIPGHEHSLILKSLSEGPDVADGVMRSHVIENGKMIVRALEVGVGNTHA